MASQHLPRLVQETIEKLTPEELVFGPDPVDYQNHPKRYFVSWKNEKESDRWSWKEEWQTDRWYQGEVDV